MFIKWSLFILREVSWLYYVFFLFLIQVFSMTFAQFASYMLEPKKKNKHTLVMREGKKSIVWLATMGRKRGDEKTMIAFRLSAHIHNNVGFVSFKPTGALRSSGIKFTGRRREITSALGITFTSREFGICNMRI